MNQSFLGLSIDDERDIRSAIRSDVTGNPRRQVVFDLDWENSFGVRYFDIERRDAFHQTILKRLTDKAVNDSMEVRIQMASEDVAIADEYWLLKGALDQTTNAAGPDRWGRTTYVLKRIDGKWLIILERIADLRAPYYEHFLEYPDPYPVPKDKLASYAGKFEVAPGVRYDIQAVGDHLEVLAGPGPGVRLAIPRSQTDFVLFLDPNDLENYKRLTYGRDSNGDVQLTVSDQAGPGVVATKAKDSK